MSDVKKLLATHTIPSVPHRYRGVWRRTLLEAADVYDVATNVLWMQTSRWHADLRIPVLRPDFSQVDSLADCNHEQLMWLAQQQGFAGITEIDFASQTEICSWHRLVDFRPPAATPDAGFMTFEATQLVETGVHAEYLEHWSRLSDTESGFAVFKYADDGLHLQHPPRFLLIAGDAVMHVRARPTDWPTELPPDFDMTQLDDTALRMMLDIEISFGVRTASGWQIQHSTLPWLEKERIEIRVSPQINERVDIAWDGTWSQWQVLEWTPPR